MLLLRCVLLGGNQYAAASDPATALGQYSRGGDSVVLYCTRVKQGVSLRRTAKGQNAHNGQAKREV